LLTLISVAESQIINKVVQFTESEIIDVLTASENYVGIMVRSSESPFRKSAILFNKKGEKILEVDGPKRSEFKIAEPVESLGYFTTVRRGGGKVLDRIRAFDIDTGQEVWETHANACFYELSPNKMHMITLGDPGTERTGIFEIINLKYGSKVDFVYEYNQYRAAWLDDERIIFVFQEWEKNKNVQKDPVLEYKKKKMKIESESFQIENLLKKGLLTQSNYDKRKQELDERQAELEKTAPKLKRSSSGRIIRPGRPRPVTPKTIKLILYNMTTKSFEQEEYLYKGDGSKISIGVFPSGSNTINVDKEKNIYIYGHDYVKNDRHSYLVKFSKNLDFIWTTKMKIGNIVRFSVDDDIYFRSKIRGDVNLIDTDTGDLIPVDEAKRSNPKIQDIGFSYRYRFSKVKIIKNVNIDYQSKTMTFFKEED